MNMLKMQIDSRSFLLHSFLLPIIVAIPLAANASPHENQGQKNNNAKSKKHFDKQKSSDASFNVSFGYARSLAIENGLTGYKGLPPGIAKQVSRGKPLPPGIAKKRLPSGFVSRLPVYVGYEWKISGRDLILVAIGTAIVAEIIEGVFE